MANVFKKIEIIGTVGKVYDLRRVGKDDRAVIDFSVAVTPRTRDGDEWVDKATVWTNCTAWGRLAENIEAGWKSGDRVFLRGYADMKDGYTNKNDEEVPPREIMIVEFGGHEDTYATSTQERKNRSSDDGSTSSNRSSSRSSTKPAAKRSRPAPAAPADDDDLDLGLDDLGDDDDSDGLPF